MIVHTCILSDNRHNNK